MSNDVLPVPPAPAPAPAAGRDRRPALALVRRWWPAGLGLVLGVIGLLDVQPWTGAEPTTWMLPGLALVYLAIGAVRRRLRDPRVLTVELLGLVVFALIALVAVGVAPRAGHHVLGAGWIGHALWDVAHHRDLSRNAAVGVVPRGYAEWCIVLDLLIGASLIVAPAAS